MSIDISNLILQQQDNANNRKAPANKQNSDFANWLANHNSEQKAQQAATTAETVKPVNEEASLEQLQMMQKLGELMQPNLRPNKPLQANEVAKPNANGNPIDELAVAETPLLSIANVLSQLGINSDTLNTANHQQLVNPQLLQSQNINISVMGLDSQQDSELIEHFLMQSWATGQMANRYVSSATQHSDSASVNASSSTSSKSAFSASFKGLMAQPSLAKQHALSVSLNALVQGQQLTQKNTLAESPTKVSLVAMSLPTPNKLKDKNLTQTRDEQGVKVWLRDFNQTQNELTHWLIEMSQSNQNISQVAYNGHVIWQR